jgi:REP element-mobilizing transposase RayT
MARLARFKVEGGEGWYHLHARVAARNGEYPLEEPGCKRRLVALLKHFGGAYACHLAAFCVMGNHWHLVIRFDAPRELSEAELLRRARVFYPGRAGRELLESWTPEQWERFACRIYDVSEFMRNVQAAFARWYNRTFDRVGRFWADRFKSTLLEDEVAVLDAMLYVELNPVRAGLVHRPEEHWASSCFLREIGEAKWLMKVKQVLPFAAEKRARSEYRHLMYWRGSVPSREGQARIPEEVAVREAERGFSTRGAFLKRVRYFSDGLAVGGEIFVRQQLTKLRRAGVYRRRCRPIRQDAGPHFSLREQRSHAVSVCPPGPRAPALPRAE